MSDTRMSRRGFMGACAALLALPAVALASRSVPGFIVDVSLPDRLRFTPFDGYDWIDLPSRILELKRLDDTHLLIVCVTGDYILTHAGTPERDWFIRQEPPQWSI